MAWGGGGAPLCDEADAWAEFAELRPSDVFVGDHAFDFSEHPPTGRADQFLRQKVPPSFEVLSWLQGALPEPTYDALRDAWVATLETLWLQAGAGLGQQPGGDIMIHGRGPYGNRQKLRDWTAGCIAVNDSEIEDIFAMVRPGTPVVIYP